MFGRVLKMPLDYLSCFTIVLRGITNWLSYSLQTKNFPLFWSHGSTIKFDVFVVSLMVFVLLSQTVNVINRNGMLFFKCIILLALVLACARAIAHIKRRRLLGVVSQMGGLKSFTPSGNKAFSTGRDGGSLSPTGQKFTYPSSTRKSRPENSSPNFYFPHQRFIPPPNNHFHLVTQ